MCKTMHVFLSKQIPKGYNGCTAYYYNTFGMSHACNCFIYHLKVCMGRWYKHGDISVVIWYTHTYSSRRHTRLFSVLLPVLSPAQCSEAALSLIAFPRPLIILMLLHAPLWACLHHIKHAHSLWGPKWKPHPSSGTLCAFLIKGGTYCHFTSLYYPIVVASSNSQHSPCWFAYNHGQTALCTSMDIPSTHQRTYTRLHLCKFPILDCVSSHKEDIQDDAGVSSCYVVGH